MGNVFRDRLQGALLHGTVAAQNFPAQRRELGTAAIDAAFGADDERLDEVIAPAGRRRRATLHPNAQTASDHEHHSSV